MEQIVFYWVGKELIIPSLLVNSARMVYGKNINIIQLSDYNTGMVSGVDKIIRGEYSNQINLKNNSLITNHITKFEDNKIKKIKMEESSR